MSMPLLTTESAALSLPEDQSQKSIAQRRGDLVSRAERCADALFQADEDAPGKAPVRAIQELREGGFLMAALPVRLGGLGLGTEAGGHEALLRTLASFGGADLALGRLYEGHINALLLVTALGSTAQQQRVAADAQHGKLFGVWNTGEPTPMRLLETAAGYALRGCKTFATGAAIVERPIVTAERHGWQMTLPRMETASVSRTVSIDRSSWQPLGMESSESFTICFDDAPIASDDLIGMPGDFYRDPLFRGGAIRFAAVQTGAMLRLVRMFTEWLIAHNRHNDPYQIARLGEVELLAQGAALWIQRASSVAEQCMHLDADPAATRRMVRCGNLTRLAVERAATALMTHITVGVGAHGLLRPARFERMLRDLTMYLRQPNPDGALADIGKGAIAGIRADIWDSGSCL